MKVLFLLRHAGFVRIFESTLRLLCERGHAVRVGLLITKERHWMVDTTNIAERLAAAYPNFSYTMVPVREDGWGLLGATLRASSDYMRYLDPLYRDAPRLRERAAEFVPASIVRWTRQGLLATRPGRAAVGAACRFLERCVPPGAEVEALLDAERPDLLLLSPLVEPGTPQSEYAKAARARRIPTMLCVASWDNLTNKGIIYPRMDLVTVWNHEMKREAVELHGVPPDRVIVTGAQVFDEWFDWTPGGSREAFCARVGLDPAEPYVLYVCSSRFIAPDEASFVRTWIQQLRASASPALRRAGVLIRPHPQNETQWRDFTADGLGNVTVYPRGGAVPVDAASKGDYFDSIHHSAAVVGVNTTAEIESAIVGRKVFTLLAPEFRDTQEGTLHFHYLQQVGGGLLHAARTFPEHLAQLEAALAELGDPADRSRRFVEAFIRPHGLGVAATPKLVEAIESARTRPLLPSPGVPAVAGLLRPWLRRHADRLAHEATLLREEKETQRQLKRKAAKERRKRELKAKARQAEPAGEARPT